VVGSDAAVAAGCAVRSIVATESGRVEFNDMTETGLDAELDVRAGVGMITGLDDTVDIGRVGFTSLLGLMVGLGSSRSLGFGFPNPKSLAKNPGFSTFGCTNSRLRITIITREILTGGNWVGLLFNNDEGSGVFLGRKPGILVPSVEVEAMNDGFGMDCGGSTFCLLRAW